MHHTTVITQAPHGKAFIVKGLVASSRASDLLTDEEFSRLKAGDVKLTRGTSGGFEYELEFAVAEPVEPAVEEPADPPLDQQLKEADPA